MKHKFASMFLAASLWLGIPAFAQVVTPEPTPSPSVVVEDGTVVVDPEPSPLTPLLAMAGSVFAIMELLKNFFLSEITDKLEYRAKAAVNWGVASALALVLMLGAPAGLDIFTATGYPGPSSDFVARLITALAIGGGNGIIHAAYEFLRTPRTVFVTDDVES